MTKVEMAKLMADHPKLQAFGWGIERGTLRNLAERTAAFERDRARLMGNTIGPTFAAWWLSDYPKTKTIGRKNVGSYHLKHVIQGMTGVYLTNGEFIAGAIYAGFKLRTYDDWPNVDIGVASRTMPTLNDLQCGKHRHLHRSRIADLLTRYGENDPEIVAYYRRTYLKPEPCST